MAQQAQIPSPRPASDLPPGRLPFKTYDVDQGLDNLAVTRIAQDAKGFLWVGTQGNLFRFDGHTFRAFGMRDGLPSGNITTLHATQDGVLWAGTWRGLVKYHQARMVPVQAEEGLSAGHIYHLRSDPQGGMWVASSNGLHRQRPEGTFEPIPGWQWGSCQAMWVHPESGAVWAAHQGGLKHRSPGGPWRDIQLPGVPEHVEDVLGDREGRVFIRTRTRLLALHPQRGFQDLSQHLPSTRTQSGILTSDRDGRVWIPTDHGLSSCLGERWVHYAQRSGLPTTSPSTAFVDREGSLWVGGQGLHRLQGLGRWVNYTAAEGLPHSQVWGVLRDTQGRLWVGTNRGLVHANAQGWEVLPATAGRAVRALAPRAEGGLWAAGSAGLFLSVDRAGNAQLAGRGLPPQQGLCVLEDSQRRVWVGTTTGLYLQQPGTGTFEAVSLPDAAPIERIGGLAESPPGTIWVGGERGLARFQAGVWRRFSTRDGLRHTHVESVISTRGHQLAVSYFEPLGFSRFATRTEGLDLLEHVDTTNRLESDLVYFLGEDAQGRLWVGTGRGVDILQGNRTVHYGKSEGLAGDDCDAQGFLAEPDGRVWIGTSTGLSCGLGGWNVDPPPPATTLLAASLQGIPVPVEGSAGIEMPHHLRDLHVQFAGLGWQQEGRIEHAFRLLGQDDTWRGTRSREVHLPALVPGQYVLEVRSRLRGGPWGPSATLAFTLEPAWWQRWWVRILFSAVAASGLSYLAILQVRRLRRRNMELETLLNLADQLTRELEAANTVLQQESTTDPLTGLKNRRYLHMALEKDVAHTNRAYRTFQEQGIDGAPPNADLVFILIDIDLFKHVNDTYGHLAGDAVLHQFADVLRGATRGSDTLIRWGGEEFMILARHTQRAEIPILVERVRRHVAAKAFELPDGQVIHRTCSLGFAPYPMRVGVPLKPEQVIDLADQCLYQAKLQGRNRWVGHVGQEAEETAPMVGPMTEVSLVSP